MAKAQVVSKETKKANEEPEVSVFGETVSDSHRHYHDAGSSVWGVFLVLIGLILIGNALDIIPWNFWDHIWQFWPILIVLWGLHVILGNNPVSRFILFVAAVISFGLITIWGLKQVGSSLLNSVPEDVINIVDWLEAQRR
jgi:hypothetical protein